MFFSNYTYLPIYIVVEKQCKNLTRDDAPDNGGLVCHWYREENSQQCGVRCNEGYEFPSRVNNYETCGPTTGYTWSFRHENKNATIAGCIRKSVWIRTINAGLVVRHGDLSHKMTVSHKDSMPKCVSVNQV